MQGYNAAPCNSNMLGYKLPFEGLILEKGSYQSRTMGKKMERTKILVSKEARELLIGFQLKEAARLGKRISQSDALVIAVELAKQARDTERGD
jgi:hypothetical protein